MIPRHINTGVCACGENIPLFCCSGVTPSGVLCPYGEAILFWQQSDPLHTDTNLVRTELSIPSFGSIWLLATSYRSRFFFGHPSRRDSLTSGRDPFFWQQSRPFSHIDRGVCRSQWITGEHSTYSADRQCQMCRCGELIFLWQSTPMRLVLWQRTTPVHLLHLLMQASSCFVFERYG